SQTAVIVTATNVGEILHGHCGSRSRAAGEAAQLSQKRIVIPDRRARIARTWVCGCPLTLLERSRAGRQGNVVRSICVAGNVGNTARINGNSCAEIFSAAAEVS